MNNIFDFATSELSQDAMICWCVNWINEPKSELFPMAKRLIAEFGVEYSQGLEIEIFQQPFKIDIMLSIKGKNRIIIIEDKTATTEHDNQISIYRNKVKEVSFTKNKYDINQDVEITTVYFKTSYFFDYDKKVKADYVVDSNLFLEILNDYRENMIVDYYCAYLERGINWYNESKDFTKKKGTSNFYDWNISKYSIAQYNIMETIFNERIFNDYNDLNEIRHGANVDGRPWTQINILIHEKREDDLGYTIFWRIDTSSKGPYISLRFYNPYNKNSVKEKNIHLFLYQKYRKQIEEILNGNQDIHFNWDDVKGGYTGNYYETSLMTINMCDILDNWEEIKASFVLSIKIISNNLYQIADVNISSTN